MDFETRQTMDEWSREVEAETRKLVREGTPPFDAAGEARRRVSQRRAICQAPHADAECEFRFYKPPFRVVECADTYYIADANDDHVAMLLWPAHPAEETESAEKATWALGELFCLGSNAPANLPPEREARREPLPRKR